MLERYIEATGTMKKIMFKQETSHLPDGKENFMPELNRSINNWDKDPAIQIALQTLNQERK